MYKIYMESGTDYPNEKHQFNNFERAYNDCNISIDKYTSYCVSYY